MLLAKVLQLNFVECTGCGSVYGFSEKLDSALPIVRGGEQTDIDPLIHEGTVVDEHC